MTGIRGRSTSGQGWRAGERKRDPSFSTGIEQQNLRGKNRPKLPNERCRNPKWNEIETTVLINCVKEGRFRKGKFQNWKALREEIKKVSGSTRTKKECQGRLDTLKKAQKEVTRLWGVNYKQFFESVEEERSGKLSTRLTQEWYEDLVQIEQQQKEPGHLFSSISDGTPSLSGKQTPNRSDLADDVGSSCTDLISSVQSSPSPVSTQFQDPAVPSQTHNPESVDLTGVPQVVQAVDCELHDGGDPGANHVSLSLESIDKSLQESEDCYYFRTYFCTYGWIPTWELNNA